MTLTADRFTLEERWLTTTDGHHELYLQQWGHPDAVPIVFLHGGLGSGCSTGHKALFDPDRHRVIFIDQRGSGRSTPHGSTEHNTTHHLVADLEQVRQVLQIPTWHVMGGSWGSTLALCYAVENPTYVLSLLLRGVFLGTREEIDWVERGALRRFYPDLWGDRISRRCTADDPLSLSEYAEIGATASSLRGTTTMPVLTPEQLAGLAIERFYNNADFFLAPDHILSAASHLEVPVHIIQGRYDMITPPISAYALHAALPDSRIQFTTAGHDVNDPENLGAVRAYLDGLAS